MAFKTPRQRKAVMAKLNRSGFTGSRPGLIEGWISKASAYVTLFVRGKAAVKTSRSINMIRIQKVPVVELGTLKTVGYHYHLSTGRGRRDDKVFDTAPEAVRYAHKLMKL